ncbi:hypothetical protein GQ457_17G014490 [Hibiscus cannabinus]
MIDGSRMTIDDDRRARIGGEANSGIFTLFVQNLPERLHWSDLRQMFGSLGDIFYSFIAGKKNGLGKRFGFVRFSNIKDVLEEKLNNQENHMETTGDRNKLAEEIKEVSPKEENMDIDVDKTTLTKMKKIIVVEVDSTLLEVGVLEMGAKDRVDGNRFGKDRGESSSKSFVESVRRSGSKNAAVDGCLDEDVNGSACEKLEDLTEMEQIEDDVLWKQTSVKHLRLKQWLLNNQKKVSWSSSKTSSQRGLVGDMA